MKLVIRKNLQIQKPDTELRSYLKSLLTTTNPAWLDARHFGRWAGNIDRNILQFEELPNGDLLTPRGQLHHLLNDLDREWEVEDYRVVPEAGGGWPEGNIVLRINDQEPAVEELMSYDNGFLSAPAGSGKTVMGLEVCRRSGLKALWLTHRKELKDQVIAEAVNLLEIPEKEIGVIHGRQWSIGKQLTVGMIPTLNKRDLSELEEEFGIIIIDEAHHIPSKTFLRVIGNFASKYIYGLTATAYRRDKLEAVMFNSVGPVVHTIEHLELFEEEHLMKATIKRRDTGWIPRGHLTMSYHELAEAIVYDEKRNKMIVEDVVRECSLGNDCMVLVSRTKHAEILTELLKGEGVRAELCVGSIDVNERTPTGKKKKNKKKKKKQIPKEVRDSIISEFKEGELQALVATYDLLAEGFNYRPLSRLFMASPIKWRGRVVQSIGRIQRTAEGKKDAIAYDYVDYGVGMFANQADYRLNRVYKKMDMPVEEC